ncbi:MAG TPA: isochorismate synthase [Solirubrobacteraceae bacterium]|jgi:salicylate biosynthesis isochorismate synthase/menaquinone-specific isochorismate synthase|nr:isochorismate synthase [Solirubrobacteraceae bacterium]
MAPVRQLTRVPGVEQALRDRMGAALRRARARGAPVLASACAPLPGAVDPSAVVVTSRRAGEPWFALEQPDRDGLAIAGLGCVQAIEGSGAGRFEAVSERWRELRADAEIDTLTGPPGSGLAAFGGFAFAPEGGASPEWHGYAPGSMMVPEVSLARQSGSTWLTVNALVAPDDTPEDGTERMAARLQSLRADPLPLFDPHPTGRYEVASPMPPAHYEEAVARAVQRIRSGAFQKVVLAREVDVHAPAAHDPGAVFGLLREAFESSYVYAVGRGDATFIGASPELLIRRQGQRATTVALAGSARRSADPAVDDHLGEQLMRSDKDREENAIVARRIARTLRPFSVWVTAAPDPVVVRVANIQHLASPIRAQLAAPMDAIELVGHLHPTPAVGAEPDRALDVIPALEGFDRGWYAGAVGWTDASGDGEFLVALRCALLRGGAARCYAGCGIVRDSDPAAELAETEVKLQVMLPVLSG